MTPELESATAASAARSGVESTNNKTSKTETNAPASTTASAPMASGGIDREKLCPFLLKMFYKPHEHHLTKLYSPTSTPPKAAELQLYTWKNATLGEIASLVRQAIPDLLDSDTTNYSRSRDDDDFGTRLHFRHIYLDVHKGNFVSRDIGTVLLADTVGAAEAVNQGDITADETEKDMTMEVEETKLSGDSTTTEPNTESATKTENESVQELFTKDIRKNKDNTNATSALASAAASAAASVTASMTPATTGTRLGGTSTALDKSLSSIRFVIGDYLDIAIISRPNSKGGASGHEQALFTARGRKEGGGENSGRTGGPIRSGRRDGGRRDRRGRNGRDRESGAVDRFAGRLGLPDPSDRNGHGRNDHAGARRGIADSEFSWKGRGRGR
ncbi:hypothetical protein FBU30_006970 [Linnemannia zychae]|nr:hypothetical protein FBU30_006970 [Linnemannia zychae]